MWGLVLKWLGGILTGPIIDGALKAYQAKLAAGNTSERIASDVAIRELAVEQREAELAAQVVIEEQGRWYTACIRPLFALPFIVFAWKVIVWDKVFGWGTTDALDPNMWSVFLTVVAAYFGGRSVEKVARILKR